MTFADFNRNIFKNPNIKWFDRTGVLLIDQFIRAEIILCRDTHNYNSYQVRIVHKRKGTITTKNFRFDYYLNSSDRIDNRKDYNGNFHVWAENGVDWYVARPSELNIKRLTDAIMEYIDCFR